MYEKRTKIFVAIGALLLLICVLRLTQMQLLPDSSLPDDIALLMRQRSKSHQLKTIRGAIIDRKSRVLAADEPHFHLCISYELSSFSDKRVLKAELLKARLQSDPNAAADKVTRRFENALDDTLHVIEKCEQFGFPRQHTENRIKSINDGIWNLRTFIAWRKDYLDAKNPEDADILKKYDNQVIKIPLSVAIADFKKKVPDSDERIRLTARVNIPEMKKDYPLFELKTDDDFAAAQFEFMDVNGVRIVPEARRLYPYNSVAAQTIGWVGPVQDTDKVHFDPNDKLSKYLGGELCGKEDGVEYVCEAILRGRRGEEVYNIDRRLVSQTQIRIGKDVRLTLDIELQQRIEDYLAGYNHNPNCGPGMAAVVIQVGSGDILALVSMPVYDLNFVRQNYNELNKKPKPLINRAINQWYPPGSVVKPVILIAAMETGKVTANEIIHCPAEKNPTGPPNCWIFNSYSIGHDSQWPNNARNAIKGSCNIYFSRLAERIEPLALQQWLFQFGYGRSILHGPTHITESDSKRNFRQLSGRISSGTPKGKILRFEQVPSLTERERRWFGIGQGKLLATPLQVANAMAAIARRGIYKPPRIFMDDPNDPNSAAPDESMADLGISPATLDTVFEGMAAVVNENLGTANKQFKDYVASFARQDVKIYGKTGSTQPANAWFAGFAEDSSGPSLAIAVVIEGGQSGASDAVPLARQILQFSIDAGYLGKSALSAN